MLGITESTAVPGMYILDMQMFYKVQNSLTSEMVRISSQESKNRRTQQFWPSSSSASHTRCEMA